MFLSCLRLATSFPPLRSFPHKQINPLSPIIFHLHRPENLQHALFSSRKWKHSFACEPGSKSTKLQTSTLTTKPSHKSSYRNGNKVISIRNVNFTTFEWQEFCKEVGEKPSIDTLTLENITIARKPLKNSLLKPFLNALRKVMLLNHLNLRSSRSDTRLGPEDAIKIIDAVENGHYCISRLGLEGNRIGLAGLMAIGAVLISTRSTPPCREIIIDLSGNHLTKEELAVWNQFLQQHPNAKIQVRF